MLHLQISLPFSGDVYWHRSSPDPIPDKEKIKEALTKASEIADIILINAGSSKGTKDFTLDLLETEGEVLVYELGCRPGKHSSFSKFNQKPVLGICLYHKFSDLWTIPLYIKKIVPEYKIYIRHHTDIYLETVCYATLWKF